MLRSALRTVARSVRLSRPLARSIVLRNFSTTTLRMAAVTSINQNWMSTDASNQAAAAAGGELSGESTVDRRNKSIEEKRSLFVSNLPHGTNWRRLKEYMEKAGTVLFARIAVYPDGSPRGYGFVEFAEAAGAARALQELDNTSFEGHIIRIREQTAKSTLKSCLVSNLPWNVTSEELAVIFSKLPGFELARVLLDSQGRSRGRAVVSFRSKEEADNAIKSVEGQEVNGRPIRIREMVPRDSEQQQQQ